MENLIKSDMNKKSQIGITLTIIIIIFFVMFIFLFFLFPIIIDGTYIETVRNGTHTGYVTAIEETGIIFRTTSVYFKTDTQSTQEDRYCLVDKSLIPLLREKEKNKEKITITFNDYLFRGMNKCKAMDNGIITGIE